MKKYHINPKTGIPSICRAESKCPYGGKTGQEGHYNTYSEAQQASQYYLGKVYEFMPGLMKEVPADELKSEIEKSRDVNREEVSKLEAMGEKESIEYLKTTDNEGVLMSVIEGEIKKEQGWEYISTALQNPNISKKFLRESLLDYPQEVNVETRKWLAMNPALTHEEIASIVEDEDENIEIRALALKNPSLNKEYASSIISSHIEKTDILPYSMLHFTKHKNKESEQRKDETIFLARRDRTGTLLAESLNKKYPSLESGGET